MTYKINNLTLDLFFFNLRQGLGDSEETQEEHQDEFIQNFPFATLREQLKNALSREEEAPNPKYTELLNLARYKDSCYDIQDGCVLSDDLENIEGYYFPVLMGDIYGVLLELELNEKEIGTNYFKRLKEEISQPGHSLYSPSPDTIEGNIGKTWMLSCRIEEIENADAIAKEIYTSFISDILNNDDDIEYYWRENCLRDEIDLKFLGANVYEIWIRPQRWDDMKNNHHIMIFIYPSTVKENDKFTDILGGFYDYWMLTFAHRNKILYAYLQTRRLKKELTQKFGKIKTAIKLVKNKPTLKELQDDLEKNIEPFSDYVYEVKELQIHLNSIRTNVKNYQGIIKHLETEGKSTKIGETNLTPLLASFIQNGTSIYDEQIERDYYSFSAGIETIDTLLNTIRGIVETQQSQRDRTFQKWVGLGGISLGSASITASAVSSFIPEEIEEWQPVARVVQSLPIPEPLVHPTIALSLSIITGLIPIAAYCFYRFLIFLFTPKKKRDRNS